MPDSDIRILEAQPYFSLEWAREPLKFGAVVQDEITFCHVRVRAENRCGAVADGWGAILLSDFWAWPDPAIPHGEKDRAMRSLVERFCRRAPTYRSFGHPVDIFMELEGDLRKLAEEACREAGLTPMPFLAALVCASPLDAALHDAFGLANGISTYLGYGPDFMAHDLAWYLGSAFRGRYLGEFLLTEPIPAVPVFHLVGGLDRLRGGGDPGSGPQDGRPASLEEWIERDQLFCLKVKLRGTDLAWDLDRVIEVYRLAGEVYTRQGREGSLLCLSADTNEQCESPAYVVELLEQLREAEPGAYEALLYVEQPTERDLNAHRHDMRALAAFKPVILDESLTGLEDVDAALELGWSGVALKTCKCQSLALLTAAKAEAAGIPYTVQDLTNPGLALLQSVGLAAHLHPMMGVEANSRQYYPATSAPEAAVHPDVVEVRGGVARTGTLMGPGLGYQVERIERDIFRM